MTPMITQDQNFEEYQVLMAEYAAGVLDEARALFLATHMAVSPEIREMVRAYEQGAAALWEQDCEPAHLSPDSLEKFLRRLEEESEEISEDRKRPAEQWGMPLPGPLQQYFQTSPGDLRSRAPMPGMETLDLPLSEDGRLARLIRMAPGVGVPAHSHGGQEMTLVLDGAMHDETGIYKKGDLVILEDFESHKPVADPEQGCICLAVTEAPIRLKGFLGKLVNPFLSH